MKHRRLGIRAQLTLIVLLAALLSTAATLFVANEAIAGYAVTQADEEAQLNTNIALLVLRTQYGRNISIASDGSLVADSPTSGNTLGSVDANGNFGKYKLDGDQDYVSGVETLISSYTAGYTGYVAVYKCGTPNGGYLQYNGSVACPVITSSTPATAAAPSAQATNGTSTTTGTSATITASACATASKCLPASVAQKMQLMSNNPQTVPSQVTIDNSAYYASYTPLLNPQKRVIGVLMVGVPLAAVAATQRYTTVELALVGVIIMIAGVIIALLFASAIIATLQRAARQVSGAVENITTIATTQTEGSAQQVWAVNSINKALQNFTETARGISERTDQLALMGNQVIQRRGEIAPAQIDQILGYMTRSVRDISLSTRQQVTQYERMTGAMQAVIEIAEQVSAKSQEANESATRLDTVVGQLQDLVGVQRLRLRLPATPGASRAVRRSQNGAHPAVRVVRPQGQVPGPANGMTTGGVQINRHMAPVRTATGIGVRAPYPTNDALGGPGYPGAPYMGDPRLSQVPGGSAAPEGWYGLPPLPGGPDDPYGAGQPGPGGRMPWSQQPDGPGYPGNPGDPPWGR